MYHYVCDNSYGIEWLQFDAFSAWPELVHGFFSRMGGVSEPPCNTLNLSFKREAQPENVRENFRRAAVSLGLCFDSMVSVTQVHGNRVLVVTEEQKGQGVVRESPGAYDGMVTDCPNIPLCTIHGDCVPVFFWDPVRRAVGMAHSGWKGTVGRIAAKMVEVMIRQYRTDPASLLVAIGPSIGQECFEVGKEVWDPFRQSFPERMTDVRYCRSHPDQMDKWFLSLPDFVCATLCEAGVPPENISVAPICTACRPDRYFSHRRDKGRTGAMAGVIALREGGIP